MSNTSTSNPTKDPHEVTIKDLYALAQYQPTVRMCLEYTRRGISTEKALIHCILVLAEQNKSLTDRVIHLLETRTQ